MAQRRLGVARALSGAGSTGGWIALTLIVLDATRSPGWVAVAMLLVVGTRSLVGPFAGYLGDAFDRRRVMIASELAGAACAIGSLLLALQRPLTDGWVVGLVALSVVGTLASAPFRPAALALLPTLASLDDTVEPEDAVKRANARFDLANRAGEILGALFAMAITGVFPLWAMFVLDACSFLVAALLLRGLPGGRGVPVGRHVGGLREGFAALGERRLLELLAGTTMLLLLAVGLIQVALPVKAEQLEHGPIGYSAFLFCWPVGAAVASALLSLRGMRRLRGWPVAIGGLCVAAVAIGSFGVAPDLVVAGALMAIFGFATKPLAVAQASAVQGGVSDRVMSRAFGAIGALGETAMLAGLLLGGLVVGVLAVGTAFTLIGGLVAVATLTLLGAARAARHDDDGIGRQPDGQ